MRQGWDFVSFSDYRSDMDELANSAAATVAEMRRQRDEARMMLAAVVEAAGGHVEVHDAILDRIAELRLTQFRDDRSMSITFKTEG